jgi:hypothetical protein
MKKIAAVLALSVAFAGPARAETGAELLADQEAFGVGFIWGATTYMVEDYTLDDEASNRLTYHRSACLSKAGINARTIYDAVVREIRSDPSLLSKPATVALQIVTLKICGAPKV